MRKVKFVALHTAPFASGTIGSLKNQMSTVPEIDKPFINVRDLKMTYDGSNLTIMVNKEIEVVVPSALIVSMVLEPEDKGKK